MSKNAASWPVTFKWVAAGTIAAYTALGSYTLNAAQLPAQTEISAQIGALARSRRFEIPAGVLDDAIRIFSQVSGIEVSMANEGIGKLSTPGFSGSATPPQALDELLMNTGVHARFTSPSAVVLELNSVTATVDVSAAESALPTSIVKFSEPLRDTAQTVDVVGKEVMEEQNVITLRDALRNVAGISIAAGEAGAQGDNLTIRGFSARNDLY
ncbi:MAG TPA: TonB-dependent receptor plug domain-containing protein, partial [Chthoniobacterales bacterium]